MKALFAHTIILCCRYAGVVVAGFIAAGILAGLYTADNFKMNSDSSKLISPDVPFRQRDAKYDALFPGNDNLILIVIDGATAERAERAAAELTAKLKQNPKLFPQVRRPDGGEFFDKNGLLYLSTGEVRQTTEQLVRAQPFLGSLAADPSLRGIMKALSTALLGVEGGQARLSDLQKPITDFAHTIDGVVEGRPAFMSWEALTTDNPNATARGLRRFIEVHPKLNFDDITPGAEASAAIRAAANSLDLTLKNGVRVRQTGPVPMSDEEFGSLADRAVLMTSAMLFAVFLMFYLAVRSIRIIAAMAVTLTIGLLITTALGLFAVHVFNIISVAFIALFVGLGVDFGIQYCVRYRHERFMHHNINFALAEAGRHIGPSIFFAAAATAAGFFAFLPTDYVGVAELGLIAGIGMGVAFVLSLTLLPALLALFKPHGEMREVGFIFLAPIDHYIADHRRRVLLATGILAVLAAMLVPSITFDFNPIDLRNPKTESVSTLLDLMKSPETSPNTINVLEPNLTAANAMAARLSKLPEVAQAITLSSFIPDDQQPKLAMIKDTASLLDTTIDPFMTAAPPSDAQVVESMKATRDALRKAAGDTTDEAAKAARNLADLLDRVANGDTALRQRVRDAFVPDLKTMLDQLSLSLQAGPVTLATIPADLKRDWIAPNGVARVQASPSGNGNDNATLEKFSAAIQKIAPDATGTPISIQDSGETILRAFMQAGVLSFVAIVLLLALALGRVWDVIMTVLPLLLTGILTLATCVVIGLPLNFANVIALPLLFGIGVAFNIYFVVAWRNGAEHLLQTALARAILFSALTTGSAFGALWLSSHPGTASMGELLMISLAWTLVTTWFFLPALLGPPRFEASTAARAGH